MSNRGDSTQTVKSVSEAWTEIRSLAQQLLQHARNQEWDAVSNLHARREVLIRHFFEESVAESEAEEVREAILSVLASDKEVMELVRREKSKAATELKKLQAGRVAKKAYTDIGTGT